MAIKEESEKNARPLLGFTARSLIGVRLKN